MLISTSRMSLLSVFECHIRRVVSCVHTYIHKNENGQKNTDKNTDVRGVDNYMHTRTSAYTHLRAHIYIDVKRGLVQTQKRPSSLKEIAAQGCQIEFCLNLVLIGRTGWQ